MTTELVPHTPDRQIAFLPSKAETGRIWGIAETLSTTDFVPKAIRGNVPAIMAAMLTGRELGILPMRALRQVSIIEGKPTPAPELMLAMALKAGHDVYVSETTRERCTVEVRRHDWPDDRVARLTWDLEDAADAGLCTIDRDTGKAVATSQAGRPLPWQAYTRAMLRSRCIGEACRAWLPDVVEGASYTPEELGATVDRHAHDVDLIETAKANGQTFDPLDGETDAVRSAVAGALGDDGPGLEEDPAGIVDAEIVEDAAPDGQDGPEIPDRTGDTGDEPEPVASPSEAPDDDAEDGPSGVDLSEIPDPAVDEPAYAAWLDATVDAYGTLAVGDAAHLIRKGWVDLADGRRMVIPGGTTGLTLVDRLEAQTGSSYRKTVRATLEGAGHTFDGKPAQTAQEPRKPDADPDVPEAAPTPEEPSDSLDERRGLLRRWKAAHRELTQVADDQARALLAVRMRVGAGEDVAWRTVDLDTLRKLAEQAEKLRSEHVPF